MDFNKKIIKEEKVAYINHKGIVEDMGIVLEKLMGFIVKNNLSICGPPFSLYFTDPSMVEPEEMVYDMAVPICGDFEAEGEIQIKIIPEHSVISAIHKGEYTNLPDTYMAIWNYIQDNKYEPNGIPKEIYFNSPHEVPVEELLTEVQFPIEDK